jgi:hypothetical protein
VDQPVEDGVRQSGIGNAAVPFGHRDLSDDHGGAAAVAVIQDFQQVTGHGRCCHASGRRLSQSGTHSHQAGGEGAAWRRFTLSLEWYQRQGAYRLRPIWLLSTRRPEQLAVITNEIVERTRSALRDQNAFFPAREGTNPEFIAAVRRALAEVRPLSIAYQTLGNSEPHRRLVEPLCLEERDQLYYLYACCYRTEANRVFRLERLQECEIE